MKPGVKDVYCNHCSVVLRVFPGVVGEALGVFQNLSLGPKNFHENLQLLFVFLSSLTSTQQSPLEAAGRVLTSMGMQVAYFFGFKIFHWNFQFDRTYISKSSSRFSIIFKV